METVKESTGILKQTVSEFIDDDCTRLAASLAYYTVFSLPPFLVIIIIAVGLVLDPQQVSSSIQGQVGNLIGPGATAQIQSMIESAHARVQGGFSLGLLLSIVGLLVGATAAFGELQYALNAVWDVRPDPDEGGVWSNLTKRVLSLGMILAIAFLLLVSLILSSLISVLQDHMGQILTDVGLGNVSSALVWVINDAVSLLIIAQLFAMMFKVLPDVKITWRDVQIGAFATALLFVIGKFLIGFYIGQSDPGEAYGAAAALAVLLLWVYYSALILLLGAEFTQIWAHRYGTGIYPTGTQPDERAARTADEDASAPRKD